MLLTKRYMDDVRIRPGVERAGIHHCLGYAVDSDWHGCHHVIRSKEEAPAGGEVEVDGKTRLRRDTEITRIYLYLEVREELY